PGVANLMLHALRHSARTRTALMRPRWGMEMGTGGLRNGSGWTARGSVAREQPGRSVTTPWPDSGIRCPASETVDVSGRPWVVLPDHQIEATRPVSAHVLPERVGRDSLGAMTAQPLSFVCVRRNVLPAMFTLLSGP